MTTYHTRPGKNGSPTSLRINHYAYIAIYTGLPKIVNVMRSKLKA